MGWLLFGFCSLAFDCLEDLYTPRGLRLCCGLNSSLFSCCICGFRWAFIDCLCGECFVVYWCEGFVISYGVVSVVYASMSFIALMMLCE